MPANPPAVFTPPSVPSPSAPGAVHAVAAASPSVPGAVHSVAAASPSAPGAVHEVPVVGQGFSQIREWKALAGTVDIEGTATFVVTSALLASPEIVTVPVYPGDQRAAGNVMPRILAAMQANAVMAAAGMQFSLVTVFEYLYLTVPPAANDPTLNITATTNAGGALIAGISFLKQEGSLGLTTPPAIHAAPAAAPGMPPAITP